MEPNSESAAVAAPSETSHATPRRAGPGLAVPCRASAESDGSEERTIDVDVESIDTRGRTLHGYAAVYNVESEDLGGFREKIAPGAFSGVLDADVRALLNHDPSQVLGRTKSGTLRLFDEQRGLRFEVDLPDSPLGENVREAVHRKDIDGASFRFTVARDSWQGDLRTVESVKELKDVTVATFGAYPAASVELRTRNNNDVAHAPQKEQDMSEDREVKEGGLEVEDRQLKQDDAIREHAYPAGSLRVEDRSMDIRARTLTEEYRSRGFPGLPGEAATLGWDEFRTASFGGTVDVMSQPRRDGVPLGYDVRWAYPAFQSVPVAAGVTSVAVMRQTSRTIPAGTAVIRNIDAVTAKPEVTTVTDLMTVPLKQIAAIETNIPNIILEQPAIETVIENDLRLAIDGGLDQLVKAAVDASGFQAPGSDPLPTSIRKAITTLQGNGYAPDTLLLTPAAAEGLDTLVSGISGGTADYVWGPGQPAGPVFGLQRRISKVLAAPAVVDSRAFGKLYVSPISLARFEVDAGSTNRSNVRLGGHAAFGTERQNAAVRIAAS